MTYPTTFAGISAATGAELDGNFNAAGLLGTIPCAVTGTNSLTMTPYTSGGSPNVGTPPIVLQSQIRFSGVAAHSNTGAVTANVGGLGALNVYKDTASGPVVLSGSEIILGNVFILIYDSALNSGAGGYHLENALVGGAPTGTAGGDLSGTYPNPAVAKINGIALGSTTASSGNLLVGSGSQWVTKAVSGDASLASTGAITVTKTSGTSFTGAATATYVAPTTWTPADNSGAALSFTSVSANYTRIGNMVFAYFSLTYPATADTSHASISGLPVAVPNVAYVQGPASCFVSGGTIAVILVPTQNTSTAGFQNMATAANVTNANLSTLTVRCLLIYPAS